MLRFPASPPALNFKIGQEKVTQPASSPDSNASSKTGTLQDRDASVSPYDIKFEHEKLNELNQKKSDQFLFHEEANSNSTAKPFLLKFPIVITHQEERRKRSELQLIRLEATRNNGTKAQLNNMMCPALIRNNRQVNTKKEIQRNAEGNRDSESGMVNQKLRVRSARLTQQGAIYTDLIASLKDNHSWFSHVPQNIPEHIRSRLECLVSLDEDLRFAIKLRTTNIRVNSPYVYDFHQKRQVIEKKFEESKSAARIAGVAIRNSTRLSDFVLRIRRYFGGGLGQKTRAEHQYDMRRHIAATQKYALEIRRLDERHLPCIQQLAVEDNTLLQKIGVLSHKKKQHRAILLKDIRIEQQKLLNTKYKKITTYGGRDENKVLCP